jgi:hypothetical protein
MTKTRGGGGNWDSSVTGRRLKSGPPNEKEEFQEYSKVLVWDTAYRKIENGNVIREFKILNDSTRRTDRKSLSSINANNAGIVNYIRWMKEGLIS